MKKFRLLLAFTLSLVFILFLSSCTDKKYPDLSKNKVVILKIEQAWLVLKPSVLTKDSYKNPNNIFLTIKTVHDAGTITGDWYKKKDNIYQIFSLNFQCSKTLDDNLAYEIIDTINVNQEFYNSSTLYNPLSAGSEILAHAYEAPSKGEIIYRHSSQNHLSKYFFTKVEVISQDSLIKYNPETKSFIAFAGNPTTKIKTDIFPIIFIIGLFILSLQVALRKRFDYFARTRQWIEEEQKRRLKKTRFGLFCVLIVFNCVYAIIWTDFDLGVGALFIGSFGLALLVCAIAWLINSISKIVFFSKETCSQEINKVIQIVIIALICLLNLLFFELNKEFAAISYLIACSPTIIVLIQIIKIGLKDAKLKKETSKIEI